MEDVLTVCDKVYLEKRNHQMCEEILIWNEFIIKYRIKRCSKIYTLTW